jgi:hypothetical protein
MPCSDMRMPCSDIRMPRFSPLGEWKGKIDNGGNSPSLRPRRGFPWAGRAENGPRCPLRGPSLRARCREAGRYCAEVAGRLSTGLRATLRFCFACGLLFQPGRYMISAVTRRGLCR